MKKCFIMILICALILGCCTADVLPSIDDAFGVEMPSFRLSVQTEPVAEETLEDGSVRLTFENITEDKYNCFNKYITEYGCVLSDFSVSGNVISAKIVKDGVAFTLSYNRVTLEIVITYPTGSYEETEKHKDGNAVLDVGSHITFGRYLQDDSGTLEPIEWLVLDVNDGDALLISVHALDCIPYNETDSNVTWENCTIRTWLNDIFYNTAFNSEEKSQIIMSSVTVQEDRDDTNLENSTNDNVFLLSVNEFYKYFPGNSNRTCTPTSCGPSLGLMMSDSGTCCWWLRTPGKYKGTVSIVRWEGDVHDSMDVDDTRRGVRPV